MLSRATGTSDSSRSRIGSIALHGRHHGAQKSTTTGSPAIAESNVVASRSSTPCRVALLQPAGEGGEPQERHLPDGLDHDRAAHLRMPLEPVDEANRHLDDAEPLAAGPVGHLDLERVALRV